MKAHVVITNAPESENFRDDYVALPKNYGSKDYFERKDVKEIYRLFLRILILFSERKTFILNLMPVKKYL